MNEDSNDRTIDELQNIDESKKVAKTPDSSEAEEQVLLQTQEQEQIVPVLKEDYSISKHSSVKEAKIEKRAVQL